MERHRTNRLWGSGPAYALAEREVVRFLRQPGRVVGALATPVLFWLFLGSGLNRSFTAPGPADGGGYLRYAYCGTLVMVVLFTAIFSAISVIQDRDEGFLQGVLIAPASRVSIAFGKILGAATLAAVQGALFLLLAPLAGVRPSPWNYLAVLAVLFVVAVGLAGLGFILAWRTGSIQSFHAIMNLVLFPMWLLSGALFPASGASRWLAWVMAFNPLTYGVSSVRNLLDPPASLTALETAGPLLIIITFGLLMVTLASAVVRRTPSGAKS